MFDASVVVSAAINPSGPPRRALLTARSVGVIALSEAVVSELTAVLARPKFALIIRADERSRVVELLSAASVWLDPGTRVTDCRDPADDIYLELALAAGADVIVSGDRDLLVLDPWRDVRILAPADFLAWASRQPPA